MNDEIKSQCVGGTYDLRLNYRVKRYAWDEQPNIGEFFDMTQRKIEVMSAMVYDSEGRTFTLAGLGPHDRILDIEIAKSGSARVWVDRLLTPEDAPQQLKADWIITFLRQPETGSETVEFHPDLMQVSYWGKITVIGLQYYVWTGFFLQEGQEIHVQL